MTLDSIELDINKRWEEGTDHHPESVKIIKALADLDLYAGGDTMCIKTGGDGDNGETMMYLLDIYFEARDANIPFQDVIAKLKPIHEAEMKRLYPQFYK